MSVRRFSAELVRLPATDGASGDNFVPEWANTLVITNALDAVVYIAWRRSPAPGLTNGYDVVVPGAAYMTVPVPSDPNLEYVSVVVDYPGAVPAGDTGLVVTVVATEAAFPPMVGALA